MDNIRVKEIFLITPFLLISILFISCDQIESKFPDYYSAKKAGIFDQGWIPNNLISNSMINIYQKTNLDLNTCVFSYNISESDLKGALAIARLTNQKELPLGINIPIWWVNKVTTLDHYSIFDSKTHDSIYIAIDKQDLKIFGWRNGLIN
jgi:hypothetical protein